MDHDEAQSLLGAYALDALEPDEVAAVEEHLIECPRCRAELRAHREVAALMGNTRTEVPEGSWEAISERLAVEAPEKSWPGVLRALDLPSAAVKRRRRGVVGLAALGVAAASVAIALLAAQVSNLNGQVGQSQALAKHGLSAVVASVMSSPHRDIVLTSANHEQDATVVVGSDGQAYWVASSLPKLAPTRTYQLWALSAGHVISLGLIGANPTNAFAINLQHPMTQLMVTNEPAHGSPLPTSSVLISGSTA